MLSKDIEIVDQIMDAPWMQRGPSYHSWQRIKTALMERRKTERAASRVRHVQHAQPAISQLYSQWCSEKNVAGGVRSYVKDFVAWAEKQQASAQ